MSVESVRATMEAYWAGDWSQVAEDAEYTLMETGQQATGREAVVRMLSTFYGEAFDARVETTNKIVTDGHALWEGELIGRHIGDFFGIAPTDREVRAPYAVVYDLEGESIQAARIYFPVEAVRRRLSA